MSSRQPRAGKTRVYVGNIDSRTTQEDIKHFFKSYGPILSVWIARKPHGFAFVEFKYTKDAEDAVYYKHGKRLLSRRLRVEMSRGGQRFFQNLERQYSRDRSISRSRSRRNDRSYSSYSRSSSRSRSYSSRSSYSSAGSEVSRSGRNKVERESRRERRKSPSRDEKRKTSTRDDERMLKKPRFEKDRHEKKSNRRTKDKIKYERKPKQEKSRSRSSSKSPSKAKETNMRSEADADNGNKVEYTVGVSTAEQNEDAINDNKSGKCDEDLDKKAKDEIKTAEVKPENEVVSKEKPKDLSSETQNSEVKPEELTQMEENKKIEMKQDIKETNETKTETAMSRNRDEIEGKQLNETVRDENESVEAKEEVVAVAGSPTEAKDTNEPMRNGDAGMKEKVVEDGGNKVSDKKDGEDVTSRKKELNETIAVEKKDDGLEVQSKDEKAQSENK